MDRLRILFVNEFEQLPDANQDLLESYVPLSNWHFRHVSVKIIFHFSKKSLHKVYYILSVYC